MTNAAIAACLILAVGVVMLVIVKGIDVVLAACEETYEEDRNV